MIEAGGVFSAAMFEAGLIDEAVIYYAPIRCGGTSPGIAGPAFAKSIQLEEIDFLQLGNDVRLRGVVRDIPALIALMLMFAPWLRSMTSLVSWVLLTTTQSSTRRPNRCQTARRLTPKTAHPNWAVLIVVGDQL